MNSAITVVQYPSVGLSMGKKVAKLFKDKVTIVSNKYTLAPPVTTSIKEEPGKRSYKDVLAMFNFECHKYDSTSMIIGARKLKVNRVVLNCVKDMDSEYCLPPIVPVVPQVTPTATVLEEPKKEEVKVEEKPVEMPVNSFSRVSRLESMDSSEPAKEATTPPVHENPPLSVDNYLQQSLPKEDDVVVKLSQGNKILKEEITKSQTIMSKLQAQLDALREQKNAKIEALQEERLSYTATLSGLTDEIKALQDAINKEKQNLEDDLN